MNDIVFWLPSGVDLAETRLLRSPTRVCTASVRLLPELPPISDYLLAAIPLRLDSLDATGPSAARSAVAAFNLPHNRRYGY